MKTYRLVNPVILGSFNDIFKSNSPNDAATQFWESLETNHIPQFAFTLADDDDKLYSFSVSEDRRGKYNINKLNTNLNSRQESKFLQESEKIRERGNQEGGRRKRYEDENDSSSSSNYDDYDDLDDLFRYIRKKRMDNQIAYWWYSPTIYSIDKVFTPTFIANSTPYVQLYFPPL